MTLKIGWLHEAEQSRGTWLHEPDDGQLFARIPQEVVRPVSCAMSE